MEIKTYGKGAVIFREGDASGCMYEVYSGRVGVYAAYGKAEQKLLMEYYPDQSFGEMGLLEKTPRSATAVALEEETSVAVVTEAGFGEYFEQNPSKVLMVMQQMSHNLRRRTDEFIRVCRSIRELSEKEGEK